MNTISYWMDSSPIAKYPRLSSDRKVDVVVIGAGITGITAAYLLKKAGHTVALVERGPCGGFDSLNTTAHVTWVTDLRLHELVKQQGEARAQLVWEAGRTAMEQIYANVLTENIDCDFTWVPAYLHAGPKSEAREIERLEKDAALARKLGFPAQFERRIPLIHRPGVAFLQQAKFHPAKYLQSLLQTIPGKGSFVFERSPVTGIQAKPMAVRANGQKIRCSYVIIATHNPVTGKTGLVPATLFQTKLFLYSTYALRARIPAGLSAEASFWDTDNPYHYLRIDHGRGHDYAIFGGEDHKTGQIDHIINAYHRLERTFRLMFPDTKVSHRWSGQVIETPDGLPYMGESSPRQFVATGFGGNGMTFGTLGAMMGVDAFLKRANRWQDIFDIHRKPANRGAWKFLKENKDFPAYLIRDWLGIGSRKSLSSVKKNQGKVLSLNGKSVAVYRDADDKLTFNSPVCTHMKCIVHWNDAEKTWDCPCHGSRFAATGEVLSGPAEKPLEKIKVSAATAGS